jgi:group I intron endonuclease
MSLQPLNKVVYRHRRNDDESIFYVGMGNEKRPYTKDGRSKFWNSIVKKHGYSVEVLAQNLSLEEAQDLEKLLIKEYGRKDLGLGNLTNLTDGGEGTINVTEEVRKKLSESRKGVRNIPIGHKRSAEFCKKVSDSKKGKVSTFKGKTHTEEAKALIRQKRALQVINKESRLKQAKAISGANNPAAKKILDLKNNVVYNTMKEAAQSIGIKYTTLSAMLNGHSMNTTNFIKLENYEFIR